MDDPLVLLREYMIGKRIGDIELSDAQIVFGDAQTFPKDVRTSYKSQRGTQDFYTLSTLLFFCKSYADDPQKRPGAYIREARDAAQAAVNIVDSTVGNLHSTMYHACQAPAKPIPVQLFQRCNLTFFQSMH